MPYLTPPSLVTTYSEYIIRVPDGRDAHALLTGALDDFRNATSFEQDTGITPDNAVSMMQIIPDSWDEANMAVPIGAIIPFVGLTPPPTYLYCYGATYLRTAYPKLYAALNPAYIIDANNFRVPDLRTRFLRGPGTTTYEGNLGMGARGGEDYHTLSLTELPTHSHTIAQHQHTINESTGAAATPGPLPVIIPNVVPLGLTNLNGNPTAIAGGSYPHNNIPPYEVVAWIIRAY